MEILNKQHEGPIGPKFLSYFMVNKERPPSAQEVRKFFEHNMNAIKRVMPSIHLRELRREEIKNFFRALVDILLNNRLSECYRRWRKGSPDCQFGILLEVLRSAYNYELMEKFDARVMRTLKQKVDESVVDFNTRFLRKLNELYTGFEDKVYKTVETADDSYEKNFLKYELINIYVTALKPKLGKEIPAVSGKEKCLEFAMKKAELLEGQFAERERTNRDRNPYVRPKILGITRTEGITC
uniref:Uncharacterized protein n=1 Tax=Strongyloides papillosus TaxID=174720 RepID=A0A0N5B5N0_STREA